MTWIKRRSPVGLYLQRLTSICESRKSSAASGGGGFWRRHSTETERERDTHTYTPPLAPFGLGRNFLHKWSRQREGAHYARFAGRLWPSLHLLLLRHQTRSASAHESSTASVCALLGEKVRKDAFFSSSLHSSLLFNYRRSVTVQWGNTKPYRHWFRRFHVILLR